MIQYNWTINSKSIAEIFLANTKVFLIYVQIDGKYLVIESLTDDWKEGRVIGYPRNVEEGMTKLTNMVVKENNNA